MLNFIRQYRTRKIEVLTFAAMLAIAINALSAATTTGQSSLPPELANSLTAAAEQLSPTTIRWSKERNAAMPMKELAKTLGIEGINEYEFRLDDKVLFKWQSKMSYCFREFNSLVHSGYETPLAGLANSPDVATSAIPKSIPLVPSGKPERMVLETAIDLTNWYNGTGEQTKYDCVMQITPLSEAVATFPLARVTTPDYFEAAGFVMPRTAREQGSSAQHLLLDLIKNGAAIQDITERSLDSGKCWQISVKNSSTKYSFLFDQHAPFALREYEELDSQHRYLRRVTCTDFMTSPQTPQLMLPRQCKVECYTWAEKPDVISTKPLYTDHYIVQSVDHSPISPDSFALHYKRSGAYVADKTLPEAASLPNKQVEYQIPADVGRLDEVIALAKTGLTSTSPSLVGPGPRTPIAWASLILTTTVVITFAVLILRQNYAPKKSRS